MESLKLKVVIGDIDIELEGNGELVHTLFNELRETGLGQLKKSMPAMTAKSKEAIEETMVEPNDTDTSEDEAGEFTDEILPSLVNIVMQGSPKTEQEWVLVYALYCSENGTKMFTQTHLRDKYHESNRFTQTRNKNFSTNIKGLVSDRYIEAVNSTDFRITDSGKLFAWTIISGNRSAGKQKAKKISASSKVKKVSTNYKIADLGFEDSEREAFRTFWNNHIHSSNIEKVIVIACWLKDRKQLYEIGVDETFTMLRIVNENTSFDIGAALKNAKNQKNFFVAGDQKGYFKITHIGEDCVNLQLSIQE